MSLLKSLDVEVGLFNTAGDTSLDNLVSESNSFLNELKSLEAELEKQLREEEASEETELNPLKSHSQSKKAHNLDKTSATWYKNSISHIKSYNTSINKFSKNILTNAKFSVDLDDAYTYPLNLNNFQISEKSTLSPTNGGATNSHSISRTNHQELHKALILHLLKSCQSEIVPELLKDLPDAENVAIDEGTLKEFAVLKKIVDNIMINHELSDAINWLASRSTNDNPEIKGGLSSPNEHKLELEFKFHILQYTLILNGATSTTEGFDHYGLECALAAYRYSQENFPKFFKTYVNEFEKMILLLCFVNPKSSIKTAIDLETDGSALRQTKSATESEAPQLDDLFNMMKGSLHSDYNSDRTSKRLGNSSNESTSTLIPGINTSVTTTRAIESKRLTLFVEEVISSFKSIEQSQSIYTSLAYEFISEYCKEMKLSNDSSIFQSILAGFHNLPNFYKYSKIQQKLGRAVIGSTRHVKYSQEAGSSSAESDSDGEDEHIIDDDDDDGDVEDGRGDIHDFNDDDDGVDVDPSNKSKSQSSSASNTFNGIGTAPFTFELPFQLPDTNTNLFNYHPIFICPVSKEQLIPLTITDEMLSDKKRKRSLSRTVSASKLKYKNMNLPNFAGHVSSDYRNRISDSQITVSARSSQVVILKFCQHLALRDSILQLSKNGTEIFKCHYCYKKHKFTDVSDAHFIDL